MSDTRCEPPPELRGVDGWHWLEHEDGHRTISPWSAADVFGPWKDGELSWHPAQCGYRYLAPVATPAEVEALRAERDTLRARVVRLEAALERLGSMEAFTSSRPTNEEERARIDYARAALSAETP